MPVLVVLLRDLQHSTMKRESFLSGQESSDEQNPQATRPGARYVRVSAADEQEHGRLPVRIVTI